MVPGVVVQAYSIIDVTQWPVANIEPRGGGVNVWLDSSSDLWLFKPVTRTSWGFQAEDRAERISAEIAGLIGVPCAQVELAERDGVRGIISRNLAPPPWELQTGSLLLAGLVDGYQVGAKNLRGRPGHSLFNIHASLRDKGRSIVDTGLSGMNAFDLFCGYLVFDALVANRDRHDENWAVLRPSGRTSPDLLCPSFDHGSALGFNLTEAKLEIYLREGRVGWWAERGNAWRFEHDPAVGPPSLVAHARAALILAGSSTRSFWLDRLLAITRSDVVHTVKRMASLSDLSSSFTVELLMVNRRRLLDEC